MRIGAFQWDDEDVLHLALAHGIEPEEAAEMFAVAPLFRRTKRGHQAAFGRTLSGRLLVVVFSVEAPGMARVMSPTEGRYYQRHRRS